MTLAEALHSRIVSGLRIVLPLLALAVLSTLFLFSREVDPSRALPFATVDAEDLARDPRITAPRFSGVTEDGTAVTMTAETVRIASGTGETLAAEVVEVLLETSDGRRSLVTAATARVDRAADRMILAGDVVVQDDSGQRIESDAIIAALDRTWLTSPGEVGAYGPIGWLLAGSMVSILVPAEGGATAGYRVQFADGVRLLYDPAAGR